MKNVIKSVVLFATLLILSSCGNSEKKITLGWKIITNPHNKPKNRIPIKLRQVKKKKPAQKMRFPIKELGR